RPETGEMLVGTTAGALVLVEGKSARRIAAREGLLGASVRDLATLVGRTAYATELGVTLIDERGAAVRFQSGVQLPGGGATSISGGAGGRLYVGPPGGRALAGGSGAPATPPIAALVTGGNGVYAAATGGVLLIRNPGGAGDPIERLGGPAITSP